jgi:hypothetical protein
MSLWLVIVLLGLVKLPFAALAALAVLPAAEVVVAAAAVV